MQVHVVTTGSLDHQETVAHQALLGKAGNLEKMENQVQGESLEYQAALDPMEALDHLDPPAHQESQAQRARKEG